MFNCLLFVYCTSLNKSPRYLFPSLDCERRCLSNSDLALCIPNSNLLKAQAYIQGSILFEETCIEFLSQVFKISYEEKIWQTAADKVNGQEYFGKSVGKFSVVSLYV